MSIQFPKFVGRDKQLSDIQAQIARQDQTVVVNIAGAGGVGKTSILYKIKGDYGPQPDKLVTDVIDFSHTVHRVQSWILEQIAAVRPNEFSAYCEKVQDIEILDPLARLYREREALEAFVEDYDLIADDYRIILLFDTVELVQETHLLEFIIELVARLRNTVLILAGRYNDEPILVERLSASFGPDQMLTFRLGGFSEKEAQLYFEQAVTPHLREINDDLRKNIYLLSDGNPIKIALSLDWLNRGIPLMPEITQVEPAALGKESPSELATLKTKFEHALMDGIRRLESPLYDITLYMAHLHKRFNRKMLEFFFFEDQKAGMQNEVMAIISHLRELPFVKYVNDDYFVLHDEMVRLVQEHVWDSVEDPDRTLRQELSQKACEYYRRELGEFPLSQRRTEQQRVTFWAYSVECTYYKLHADFRSGYYDFEELFEKLVDDHRPGLASLAVNFLREFTDEAGFSDLLACFIDGYYDGGVLLSQQKFREAEKTLTEGEKRLNRIVSTLDLQQASPLDWHLSERLYKVYHQLGFCYRSMGDWEKAIQNYSRALDLALKLAEEQDKRSVPSVARRESLMAQIAETLNSLSNVHRLRGNLHEARMLCKTSILLRQTWDQEQVTKSQYVMGMILWEMGCTSEAMRYLRAAEKSCPPEDEGARALVKKYRAYILYRAGLPHLAAPLLAETASTFRRRGQFSELADAQNMRSRIYREHPHVMKDESADQDHMTIALQFAEEAYGIAERIGDQYHLAECHLTLALHYYRWSQLDSVWSQDHRQRALQHHRQGVELAKGRYYQLLSLYSAVRGNIAFDDHNYDLAFDQYAQQCELATHFKRAVYERSIDTIGNQLRALGTKDTMLVKRYADRILEFWQQEARLNAKYPELIDEIREIKKAMEAQEELERLGWQYDQAMLSGMWREATEYCNRILEIPSLYNDVNRANVILNKVRAMRRLGSAGDLSEARRLAKVALQIGIELDTPALMGSAHHSLARVLWDTTSTAEAAVHLVQAEDAFVRIGDEIGLARVRLLRSYIRHRTGFFQEPMDELAEAVQVFRQNGLDSELADVWNVMSRIARTDPQKPSYAQAREYAERALQRAQSANDTYRIAECYLSLAILAYRGRRLDDTLQLCNTGLAVLSPETHLLRSVYQGIQGNALFEQGCEVTDPQTRALHWDQAFDAFALELVEATKSKPARLIRALDLIHDRLLLIPAEEIQKYTKRIEEMWRQNQLVQKFPIVMRMCEQAVQYRPYV